MGTDATVLLNVFYGQFEKPKINVVDLVSDDEDEEEFACRHSKRKRIERLSPCNSPPQEAKQEELRFQALYAPLTDAQFCEVMNAIDTWVSATCLLEVSR